jgi:hypothetical protein
MGDRWFDSLRPCSSGDAVLFYLARWCQKKAGAPEPDVAEFGADELRDAGARIARNLAADGARVERLVAGRDPDAWTKLGRELLASARPRVRAGAADYAKEALQKIAEVLLTGTPPTRAPDQLDRAIEGPGNEYVFDSPFSQWARTIVINLITDDKRRAGRRAAPPTSKKQRPGLDRELLARAARALPSLLDAIRDLPPVQRSVLALSLARTDVDELVREHLHELAPDLLEEAGTTPIPSDREIADRLDSTVEAVRASRSAARRKLAQHDPLWELLLDALLPHRTTRPGAVRSNA